ncbi:MAG TPA: aminotransferase class I/II-fold pyridoxal phosphate-dependent enzyme [Gemmatimonadaceae bacterium]|nr:aminotransferase class I/II-fold pyridoxal phosphate-dependent enzyme [Gemmatimonadaceae bacterium]
MAPKRPLSRRGFVGGVASALGAIGVAPTAKVWARGLGRVDDGAGLATFGPEEDYDSYAKLANNENPYGPPESVMKAMMRAMKYSNRYGYPDSGLTDELSKHHGVKPENILLAAGSGEILDVCCTTFLQDGKMLVGVDPSYNVFYSHATSLKSEIIKLPLLPDYRQDIPAMIRATRQNYRDVGLVYMCNPNNPTGRLVTKDEIRQLLDGIPEDVPVLIDEAYHHFVDDPSYATSVPYVIEGRQVIVARTFSKIAALAGMRLGYALAPKNLVQRMKPYTPGSINAMVRYGGVAALKDTESQAWVKRQTIDLRTKTTKELAALGYATIPSDANFFMVHLKRPVVPVIDEFKKKGVLVGRPFPPLNEHLRVSVGTADEMSRFMVAFRDIMTSTKTAKAGG